MIVDYYNASMTIISFLLTIYRSRRKFQFYKQGNIKITLHVSRADNCSCLYSSPILVINMHLAMSTHARWSAWRCCVPSDGNLPIKMRLWIAAWGHSSSWYLLRAVLADEHLLFGASGIMGSFLGWMSPSDATLSFPCSRSHFQQADAYLLWASDGAGSHGLMREEDTYMYNHPPVGCQLHGGETPVGRRV